jgi:hypothetical protein
VHAEAAADAEDETQPPDRSLTVGVTCPAPTVITVLVPAMSDSTVPDPSVMS